MLKMLLVDMSSTDMMAGLFGSDIASNGQDAARDVEDAIGGTLSMAVPLSLAKLLRCGSSKPWKF